ncbi:DUF3349 domain-containing protein [Nocardia puris]|uniref:Uncharacterized protein n=1 Tax=Nocardia puris TaxID=208602 RepID=A0A366DKK9_9NOCA|nr:DUF3349 domain-containing protein [Nocardia puris]RBO90617.1 hypothetical protein DFR74_10519 [Nocardia puris]
MTVELILAKEEPDPTDVERVAAQLEAAGWTLADELPPGDPDSE